MIHWRPFNHKELRPLFVHELQEAGFKRPVLGRFRGAELVEIVALDTTWIRDKHESGEAFSSRVVNEILSLSL